MRWKALAEIYTMHSFAPFWNRIPQNEENHGGKRSWSNPGKTGQEERIGNSNLLPSTTTGASELNKNHVRSMRPYMAYVLKAQNFVQKSLKFLPIFRQSLLNLTCFRYISAKFCRNFAGFPQLDPGEVHRAPGGCPQATPQSPRSLHFRGKRPIPRLQKLASSCARPLAAALRDHGAANRSQHAAYHVFGKSTWRNPRNQVHALDVVEDLASK